MIKKNKWTLLISSIVILLPVVFGLIFWNDLPEQVVTHWGADGSADGWSSRACAVFRLPLFILAAHWICVLFTARDPRNSGQSRKVSGIVLWICPSTSLVAGIMVYANALGKPVESYSLAYLVVGLFLVIVGNYLPKCKQNSTIGIRVKWAMESEENWNATHRVCGKLWVIVGILMMVCACLPETLSVYVCLVLIAILSMVSMGYSYYYYKMKQGRS